VTVRTGGATSRGGAVGHEDTLVAVAGIAVEETSAYYQLACQRTSPLGLNVVSEGAEPDQRRSEVDECEIVATGLLESGGETTAALDPMKEALDAVPNRVELLVVATDGGACRVRRNDRLHAPGLDGLADLLRVVSRIADKGTALGLLDQRIGNRALMLLAWRQLDVKRPSSGVDDRVDLRRESTT
jgi:hypothetical protein